VCDPQTYAYQVEVEEPGRVVVFILSGRLGPEEAEGLSECVEA
jgi:hypothetical protein